MQIRRGFTAALAALTAGLLVGAVPGHAQAAVTPTATPLPLKTVADVVSAGDRVFVSGGRSSTDVVVTSATGALVGTLSGLPGPTDLLVSADRRTLYVALPAANAIAAFDTGSLIESARYDTGAGECPSSLALTGRYLWFGYGCDQWGGNIGQIDLGRQPARLATQVADQDFYDAPLLTAASQNRAVLLAGQPSLSPASVYAYGIGAAGTLSTLRTNAWSVLGSNLRDIALDPTGTTLYTAAGAPYEVQAFPFADISAPSATYPTGAYPNAVEVSRDGTRIAGGADASYDPDVFVFTPDGTELARFELGDELSSGALAWSPNGARLYAVAYDWTGVDQATLHVLPIPAA
ncbi:YncE family protein [Micromonospora sp. CPCC 205558]|uniref:YncE family protein n=1 Tax=Micromonospora sp. CPCC 205558 TaxID=3122403 RepID=UPI002FEF9D01